MDQSTKSSSCIRAESIQVINESLSFPPIDQSIAQLLAHHCENQLKTLALTASKIARHSYQTKVSEKHFHEALAQLHEPPVLTGSQSINLNNSSTISRFKQASDDVFYVDDPIIDFDTLLTTSIPPPQSISLSLHWLAIEGVQPRISQNPIDQPSANPSTNASAEERPIVLSTDASIAHIKPLMSHMLTKEQQLYFERAIDGVLSTDQSIRQSTLSCLSNDSGMQQLVPYFVHFIGDEIAHHLRDLNRLMCVFQLMDRLMHSQSLYLEPYLHQLLPSALTCCLSKHLCSSPYEAHWLLRDEAARLIGWVCKKYASIYPSMHQRIVKTFVAAWLDVDRSLTTHYGALKGLASLGNQSIKTTVIPYASIYQSIINPLMDDHRNPIKRMEAIHVHQALVQMIGRLIGAEILSPAVMALVHANQSTKQSINQSLEEKEELSNVAQRAKTKQRKISLIHQSQSKKRALHDQSITQPINQSTNQPIVNVMSSDLPVDQLVDLFGEALQPYVQSAIDRSSTAFPNHHTYHISQCII